MKAWASHGAVSHAMQRHNRVASQTKFKPEAYGVASPAKHKPQDDKVGCYLSSVQRSAGQPPMSNLAWLALSRMPWLCLVVSCLPSVSRLLTYVFIFFSFFCMHSEFTLFQLFLSHCVYIAIWLLILFSDFCVFVHSFG